MGRTFEKESKNYRRMNTVWLLVALILGLWFLEIDIIDLLTALPDFSKFFFTNFWPPKLDNLTTYLPYVVQTILFAVVATYISAFVSTILALLMSEVTCSVKWIRVVTRLLVSFLRNIPIVILAQLLVYVFGIGNLVGVIALILNSIGLLARSYADQIDEIDRDKLVAIRSTGASYWQVITQAVAPEFAPSWLNWTLFSFEINMRSSSILGMVGAGGLGIIIQSNIRLFKYRDALSLIMILVILILLTEFIVNKIRQKII